MEKRINRLTSRAQHLDADAEFIAAYSTAGWIVACPDLDIIATGKDIDQVLARAEKDLTAMEEYRDDYAQTQQQEVLQ